MAYKYEGYNFRINWTSSIPFNSKKETVEVRITTQDGQEYSANFTAKGFIDYIFEKNKRTGECKNSTYFYMPRMIIVEDINETTIKATIDDLINNLEIEGCIKKID